MQSRKLEPINNCLMTVKLCIGCFLLIYIHMQISISEISRNEQHTEEELLAPISICHIGSPKTWAIIRLIADRFREWQYNNVINLKLCLLKDQLMASMASNFHHMSQAQ